MLLYFGNEVRAGIWYNYHEKIQDFWCSARPPIEAGHAAVKRRGGEWLNSVQYDIIET